MFALVRNAMRPFARFAAEKRGAAAVEFAIVLLPFTLLTIGVAEVGLVGYSQSALDFAVNETARQIRTGQAQQGGLNQTQIKDMLCDEMGNLIFIDCTADMFMDVQRFDSFVEAATVASPMQNDEFVTSSFGYDPGAPSDIVVVRAFFRWRPLTPAFRDLFKNVANGDRIIASTMMFRNEPYE
ncbi:MAG: TadE/TadG family type IV pilus assembly protein [Terricaulis sp.]